MITKEESDINSNIQTQNNFCQKRNRKIFYNKMKIKKEKKKTIHWSNISCSATAMERLLMPSLNYIRNIYLVF